MSTEWEVVKVSVRDIERREPYKMEAHQFKPTKKLAWLVCSSCGLVTLRNKLTTWCVRMGCNAGSHPGYKEAVRSANA